MLEPRNPSFWFWRGMVTTSKSTGNKAQVYYQFIALHLIILILKLSECPRCLLLRVHQYLLLPLHAREIHAHEVNAHEGFYEDLARQNTVAHLFRLQLGFRRYRI